MAWTFEDKFNSDTKSVGDLNGQDGWSGGTEYDVSAAQAYDGNQAVMRVNSGDGSVIDNTFSAITAGSVYFALRMSTADSGDEFYVTLRDSGTAVMRIRINANLGTIAIQFAAGYSTIVSGVNINAWYVVNVEFDDGGQPNQYRARVHDGVSWSSFTSWGDTFNSGYTDIDGIRFEYGCSTCDSGTEFWVDTITPTDPTPAPAVGGLAARGLNLLGVGY